jgi:hypothetical protein
VIKDNVIEKGANAQNANVISFGEEGNLPAGNSLSVTGNTVINDDGAGATFVVNDTTVEASVTGNTLYGMTADQVINGPVASPEDNTFAPQSSEPGLGSSAPYLPVMPFSFACFAAGTRILTADGAVAVEALTVGQQVIVGGTGDDDEGPDRAVSRTIRWIGHRYIDFTRHAPRCSFGPFAFGRTRSLTAFRCAICCSPPTMRSMSTAC